jgi:hypothetical protein
VVPEVAQLHTVDSSVNGDLRLGVAKLTTPLYEEVFAASRQIMANFVHDWIIVYKRKHVKKKDFKK